MKVITMESSAYKEMMAQIANIAGYIREARDEKKRKRETEDKLLDTAQAAKMLNVSKRTMQRMRTDHRIEYVVAWIPGLTFRCWQRLTKSPQFRLCFTEAPAFRRK